MGFWNQLMFWHVMTQPTQPTVVVANPGVAQAGVAAPSTVVVQSQHGVFYYFAWTVIVLLILGMCLAMLGAV